MRDVATRICREYLSGAWKTISSEEIQVKRISGGLSNFLYYVSLPSKHELVVGSTASKRPRRDSYQTILEPTKVLLRIYGQTHGEHALETMLTESVVFTLLSERRLGPKLHGIFPGGRIEQYIPARALTTAELGKTEISLKIATKMSEIHSLDIPVSKDPDWLFNTINRWLNTVDTIMANIKNNNNDDEDARTHVLSKKLSKINFRYEAEWLKKVIENAQYPVLFCHNDLQEGNILFRQSSSMPSSDPMGQFETDLGPLLISSSSSQTERSSISKHDANGNSRKRSVAESSLNSDLIDLIDCNTTADDDGFSDQSAIADDEPELMIIDFEYCAYNYRAFDIANHFLEWTYDYTNDQFPFFYHRKEQYPTAQQMDSFLTTYLSRTIDDVTHLPILQEKKDLMEEIALFTLASHLFWGIWGIVNIHQDIEFGYWEYADVRLNEYFLAKEKYIDMNPNVRDIHDLGVRRK